MKVEGMIERVLRCRSVRDKMGLPVNPVSQPPGAREAVDQLVAEGYLVWIDRAFVTSRKVECDVYLFTPKGVALCEEHGIEQKAE